MPTAHIENLKEFRDSVANFANKIVVEDVKTFIRAVAFTLYRNIISSPRHPVDTGHARNNWQISNDVPSSTIFPQRNTKLTTEQLLNRAEGLPQSGAFTTIWLVNNVNYIGFLENGTAKIEPFKFVAGALEKTAQEFPEG